MEQNQNQNQNQNQEQNQANPLERKLNISVNLENVLAETDKQVKKQAKKVKMQGFRPGHVPLHLVKQMYGAGIYQEQLEKAIQIAFYEKVKEQKIEIAGQPRIEPAENSENSDDNKDKKEIEFTAIFEVYPEFELNDFTQLKVEKPVFNVTDAEVEKTIDVLRKQQMTYRHVDDANRTVQKEDRVTIDFIGKKDGEPFEGGKAENYPFIVGQRMMLEDFENAVEGMKVGEEKTFNLTFPAEYFAKDLAGKEVEFTIKLHKIEEPSLPEVDADFAKKMGIADGDVEKFKAEAKKNLETEVEQRLKNLLKNNVFDALKNANPIDLPKALIDLECKRMAAQAKQDMQARGMMKTTKDFPIQESWFAEQAEDRVALGLLVSKIIETYSIKADAADVRAFVEKMSQAYEKPDEIVKWYYSDPQRLRSVENYVIEDNVIKHITNLAEVKEIDIEFEKLMQANPLFGNI